MRSPSLLRRLLFAAAALTLGWLAIELLALVWLLAGDGGFDPSDSAARRRALRGEGRASEAAESPGEALAGTEVVHPFVGYVRDPERDPRAFWDVNPEGFLALKGARPTAPDEVVVGVFGGSVANIMALGAQEVLLAEIGRSTTLAGRPLRVVSYAMGGYKQPQQLMALAWALSESHPLHLVVELDGFNEVVLPIHELGRSGAYPFYPNLWPRRVSSLPDAEAERFLGRLALWQGLRRRSAALCDGALRRFSPTCELAWRTLDRTLARREVSVAETLSSPHAGRAFRTHGPVSRWPDQRALRKEIADHWLRSSLLMHDLARGRGIPYLHVLQPNQYVEGAKPLSAEERRRFAPTGNRNEPPVRLGYPALRARSARLQEAGVDFFDATELFLGEERTMYSDDCCHLNGAGNRRLAAAVGRRAASLLDSP